MSRTNNEATQRNVDSSSGDQQRDVSQQRNVDGTNGEQQRDVSQQRNVDGTNGDQQRDINQQRDANNSSENRATNGSGATNGQTTPAVTPEIFDQVKEMLEELLKKSKEQETINKTVTAELRALSAASRPRGAGIFRRPAAHVTPAVLLSTPADAQRTRGAQDEPTTGQIKEANASAENGTDQVIVEIADDTEEEHNIDDSGSVGVGRAAHRRRQLNQEQELTAAEENLQWVEQIEAATARKAAANHQQKEMDELKAALRQTALELKEMRSQVHRATSKAPEIDRVLEEARATPFTERITRVRLSDPGKIKVPTYDGKTDPTEYITAFSIAMGRANFRPQEKDIGYCLLFVEHLKGAALHWFSGLERNSIDNFEQLSEGFLKQYAILIERRSSEADLWTMSQGATETLRSFIERFKLVLTQVKGIDDKSALEALKKALWYDSDFRKEMTVNEPSTIQDALHRATGFAKSEEEVKILAQKHGKAKISNCQISPAPPGRKQQGNFVQHEGGFKGAHNYRVDSPDYSRGGGRGREKSHPGRSSSNTWTRNANDNDSAYCELHRSNGHSTANCRVLGSLLAAKLAAGELGGDISIKDFEIEEYVDQREVTHGESNKRERQIDNVAQGGQRRKVLD